MRLCANTGCALHLIEPLGFNLDAKKLRRAGLDYHEWSQVQVHRHLEDLWANLPDTAHCFACSTKGSVHYTDVAFKAGDVLMFGPETRGLPNDALHHAKITDRIRIPMQPQSRSLNLSNSVAVIAYEALRQMDFLSLN